MMILLMMIILMMILLMMILLVMILLMILLMMILLMMIILMMIILMMIILMMILMTMIILMILLMMILLMMIILMVLLMMIILMMILLMMIILRMILMMILMMIILMMIILMILLMMILLMMIINIIHIIIINSIIINSIINIIIINIIISIIINIIIINIINIDDDNIDDYNIDDTIDDDTIDDDNIDDIDDDNIDDDNIDDDNIDDTIDDDTIDDDTIDDDNIDDDNIDDTIDDDTIDDDTIDDDNIDDTIDDDNIDDTIDDDNIDDIDDDTSEPGLVPPPLPPRRLESQMYPRRTSLPPLPPPLFSLPPPPPPLFSLPPPLPARGAESQGEQSIRLKANVNVLSLSVGRLVDISRASGIQTTQSPVMHCGRCSAALSSLSSVKNTQDTAVWLCEFCGLQNTLSTSGPGAGSKLGPRVRGAPRGRDVIYLPLQSDQDYQNLEDVMVVFCVDISGSMSVTSEVTPGNAMRSPTYVSRLQSIQDALQRALSSLLRTSPLRRVAIVTFNDEVVVYGDGSGVPVTLRDWALVDYDYLRQQGQQYNTPHCIAESHQHLSLRVKELREHGATALGPAALVSVAMASRFVGSKVILCTDGRANIGLGEMEESPAPFSSSQSPYFYRQLANEAANRGVIVSVMTFEGTDCRLAEVGLLADQTGGRVRHKHPLLSSYLSSSPHLSSP
uniref:VWFA domain-containing protein n=1 Tax=Hucho hucho TaxID=62062 RepID=A0A4W5MD88_9TELE